MNLVLWNITLKWNKVIPRSFDFDIIETLWKTWNKNIYFFGETEIKSSAEFMEYLQKEMWEILNFDFSISSEDKIEFLPYDYEEKIYELVTFEWEDIDFKEIVEKFKDSDSIFSIREAWISEKFWTKIIKCDFIY